MKIKILRIGHRRERDHRISTHCGLVSRALGANSITFTGERDEKMLESIKNVVDRWGGNFEANYEKQWKKVLNNFKGEIIHLTMYGSPIQKKIKKIKDNKKDKIIIVGGEKVPPEIYDYANYNISVTNQPHSEIAALAVFLDQLFEGKELSKTHKNAKIKITPMVKGKKVTEVNRYKSNKA